MGEAKQQRIPFFLRLDLQTPHGQYRFSMRRDWPALPAKGDIIVVERLEWIVGSRSFLLSGDVIVLTERRAFQDNSVADELEKGGWRRIGVLEVASLSGMPEFNQSAMSA